MHANDGHRRGAYLCLSASLSLSLPSLSACAFVWRTLDLALRSATQCTLSACVSGNGKDRACDMEFMNTF